jgi:hypothetical protein
MSNPPAEETRSARTNPQISPIQSYNPMRSLYRSPQEAPATLPVFVPPLRRYENLSGVHSILNPQAELVEQQRSLKRRNSQMDSPSIDTQNSQRLPSISRPNSVDSNQSTQEGQQHAKPFQPPVQPSIRPEKSIRNHGLGKLNPPTGMIVAQQLPSLTASTPPTESMTIQPALPIPSAIGRPHYLLHTALTPPPNMKRTEIRQPSVNLPLSGSASLIPYYSPYSQLASVAPSRYGNHSTQGPYGQMHDSREGSVSMESGRNSMTAMATSNQSSVHLMTIQSQNGSLHNIQVETQTASKCADEKRRRNAGASARFRARRKEKEREASMSISRLEQSVRDSNEDAEYYRSERGYWRSVAMQAHPGRHITRPPSPRQHRHAHHLL